ncbi:glycosyltransferase family 9 protein [uncultured Megasphaera sp.]|uniref:glycosyltransferase family 9 protein n=1 Tax=uncultured Megasphaera sp. TaxID=165188 RepID=UPI002595B64B|nr:glycosyltransferase family 9 protein [uncultured Megasphaera sp.]
MESYKNILIIRMSSLGDIIHTLPTLYAIRNNWPQARIVWAVHKQFRDILPGKPYIDEVVYIDERQFINPLYWWNLHKQLRAYDFDLSLDLQGWAKSGGVALCSGAKRRVGYWELQEGSAAISTPLIGKYQHGNLIERYLDTVRVLGGKVNTVAFPLPDFAKEKKTMTYRLQKDGLHKPYVVIVPGSRWELKEWPVLYWRQFIQRLISQQVSVVLLGSKGDKKKGDILLEGLQHPFIKNYMGKTTIKEMMAVIQQGALFISADTGPLHIANALKRPLIALFGTTCAERSAPYYGTDNAHIHTIISPTSRATVWHPKIKDAQCMAQITVDQVWHMYKQCCMENGIA